MGIRCGWRSTYNICVVLPHYYEVGEGPSAGMSGNFPQRRLDVVTIHVQIFLLGGCGASEGEGAAYPL